MNETAKIKRGRSVFVTEKSYQTLKQLKAETDVCYRRLIERSLELFQAKRSEETRKARVCDQQTKA